MSCGVGESDGKVWALLCTLPTSQLNPPTLPLFNLRHSSFSNTSFAFPTSQALHLRHLASRPCLEEEWNIIKLASRACICFKKKDTVPTPTISTPINRLMSNYGYTVEPLLTAILCYHHPSLDLVEEFFFFFFFFTGDFIRRVTLLTITMYRVYTKISRSKERNKLNTGSR